MSEPTTPLPGPWSPPQVPATPPVSPAPTSWPPPPAYPPPGLFPAPGAAPVSAPPPLWPPVGGPSDPTAALPRPVAPTASAPRPPGPGRRILLTAALVGLTFGLLGGGLGALLVERTRGAGTTAGQGSAPAPGPGATARPQGSVAQIAATALPSVVTVKITTAEGSGNGSGFVIDTAGHIVTNNHVVAASADPGTLSVELSDGTTIPATVVGSDASYDLAVLKVDRTDLPALSWGRSADVVVGDPVIAVGAPLGLESTVTSGIVSALHRPVAAGGDGSATSFIDAIQTDAAINPGNSGGPLLDGAGQVIGVNAAIARAPGSTGGTSGNIGVGFAIPSDQAAKTAAQLIASGKAVHPVIGVRLDTSYTGEGARVLDPGGVPADSPAAAAGLRDGDIVVAFDGRKVLTPEQLIVATRARNVGDTVAITVMRDGQQVSLSLTLQTG